MRIELTDGERFIEKDDPPWVPENLTLAWRAFEKAIGVQLDDPILPMDGDGSQREPISGRWFYFEEAKGDRYLSLGHVSCWDGGAMRSLSPEITYVSYNVAPDGSFVDFHGWHRPREESRIIVPKPTGDGPYLTRGGLAPIGILVGVMRRLIAHAEQTNA